MPIGDVCSTSEKGEDLNDLRFFLVINLCQLLLYTNSLYFYPASFYFDHKKLFFFAFTLSRPEE